jgi:predicted DNA-binding transcriptional regulator AlpA
VKPKSANQIAPAVAQSADALDVGRRPVPADRTSLRRGLSRTESATYVGISARKFDELVADGRMPQPRRVDARKIWDLHELDRAFDELPHDGVSADATNTWDDV